MAKIVPTTPNQTYHCKSLMAISESVGILNPANAPLQDMSGKCCLGNLE